jgi:hypothetical protein
MRLKILVSHRRSWLHRQPRLQGSCGSRLRAGRAPQSELRPPSDHGRYRPEHHFSKDLFQLKRAPIAFVQTSLLQVWHRRPRACSWPPALPGPSSRLARPRRSRQFPPSSLSRRVADCSLSIIAEGSPSSVRGHAHCRGCEMASAA